MNRMNRSKALTIVKNKLSCRTFLQKAEGGGFVCPKCRSGTGVSSTGALNFKPYLKMVKCYAPDCDFVGDVLDLMSFLYNIDFEESFYLGRKLLNVAIDNEEHPKADYYAIMTGQKASKIYNINAIPVAYCNAKMNHNEADQSEQDHTAYYFKCHNNLIKSVDAWLYLKDRGISLDTAKRFMLGYDSACDIAHTGHKCRRVIIPCTKSFYIGRSIEPNTPKQFRAMQPKGLKPYPFNLKALKQNPNEIFITEGVWDALSMEEVGYKAIALNGVSNTDALTEALTQFDYKGDVIIAFDNDASEATRTTINGIAEKLKDNITAKGLRCYKVNTCGKYKDPNEHLIKVGRDAFLDELAEIVANLY